MNNRLEIESAEIEKARARGEDLKQEMTERDTLFSAIETIYNMEWILPTDGTLHADDVKKTISPDGRNAIETAVRLLTTTDPQWKITVKGDDDSKLGEKMEKAAELIWNRSGMMRRRPPHYDIVRSLMLYDEAHVAISSLREMAKALEKSDKKRAEQALLRTPFAIEVWNPREGYPYFDQLGLAGYYRSVQTSAIRAAQNYGAEVYSILEKQKKSSADQVQLDLWYDLDQFIVWIDGVAVVAEAWNLPFLPIDVTIGNGSALFAQSDENRQPLLYGMHKSGMWERQNQALTVMYTNIARMGLNPLYIHEKGMNNMGDELTMDYRRGIIEVPQGDRFVGVPDKQIIDPALAEGMALSERKIEESTVFKTASGQSLGGSVAFSTYALLSQSGRLPLVVPQRMAGEAIANVMDICLRWYPEIGEDCPGIDLRPQDIPELFEIAVKLEVDLPQDKLQQANIAVMLNNAGIADMNWTRENVLQITNGGEMEKKIWKEKASRAMFEQSMRLLLEQQQQAAMAGQGQTPSAPTGGGMPMQGQMPEQMPMPGRMLGQTPYSGQMPSDPTNAMTSGMPNMIPMPTPGRMPMDGGEM